MGTSGLAAQLGASPDRRRDKPGLTGDERALLLQLDRENRELRRPDAMLNSASVFVEAGLDRPSRADRLRRPAPIGARSRAELPRPV